MRDRGHAVLALDVVGPRDEDHRVPALLEQRPRGDRIAFTKIGGGLAVTVKVKFIAWAEKSAPDAVKKEPLISKVPKGTVASAENGLSVVAIDDKVTLSFGVTK